MNKLRLFNYEENNVRVLVDSEESTWFAGVDVCKVLGYQDPTQAILKLDDDERKLDRVIDSSGQKRKTWTVNEPGLYSLILTSTKPEAKAFKRWILHEVLPAIRKAGRYGTKEQADKDLTLRKLHREIANLELTRAETNAAIKEKRAQFYELLYTDPDQLKLEFN